MDSNLETKAVIFGCAFLVLGIAGLFFFTAMRFFLIKSGGDSGSGSVASTTCGLGKESLVAGFDMLPGPGKLGHEEHLNNINGGSHYCGSDSGDCGAVAGGGAFAPHTVDQERWYFNTQWGGFDWAPTAKDPPESPKIKHSKKAQEARKKIAHSRLIVTSKESGKSIVVSAEESGPALYVTKRDGINSGAPPEVYKYLDTSNPYTGNPNDGKGDVTVQFASDQNIKLGPCS